MRAVVVARGFAKLPVAPGIPKGGQCVMISWREAHRRIAQRVRPAAPVERVPLDQAVGRVLSTCPPSDSDLPPFDRVTMDGYAVRASDLAQPGRLRCTAELPAGSTTDRPLGPGEAYRIMTGAPLPPGADSVVMVEQTEIVADEEVAFSVPVERGQNVHRRGEDLSVAARPLDPGHVVCPASVAVLATLGATDVEVARRPTLSIVTSGSELVEAGETPGPGQIRDSNRTMIATQATAAGAVPQVHPIAPDDRAALRATVERALESDFVVLTGGSSVGDYDFSIEVVRELGGDLQFDRVSIKPGKPVQYFLCGDRHVFCLPGNPVSAFVTFELFVRPALRLWQGDLTPWLQPWRLPLADSLRAPASRDLFQVSRLVMVEGELRAQPIRWHGSGDLVSMKDATMLVALPAGTTAAAGDVVEGFVLDGAAFRGAPLAEPSR